MIQSHSLASVESNSESMEQTEQDGPVSLSKEAQARVEVALYASGRPMSLDELAKVARIGSRKRLRELLLELSRRINGEFAALELKEMEGPMYSLQLKPQFNAIAKKFATKPLLSAAVLRTLSYVVYLQPVTSSDLVQRRGSQVYSHLKDLLEVSFVRAEKRGRTRVFTTTDTFADYFGLSRDPEQQRKQVAKQGLITKAQQAEKAPAPQQ